MSLWDELFLLDDKQHSHLCPRCGTVWEHSDRCAYGSEEVFDEAHTCPKCGKQGICEKYFGHIKAKFHQVCSNDTVTLKKNRRK